jgi:hypothetical protein
VHDWGSGINGNVGRNSIYYPGRQDWNLSVMKNFKITEGQRFQVRADFFNAFNHPNAGQDSLGSNYGNINSANFLNTALTLRGARHIALWAKYEF